MPILKFGEKSHIMDLYENGTIFMNPIEHFRHIQDGGLRGDDYEGLISVKNYSEGMIEIPSFNFKGRFKSLHLKEFHTHVLGNIFSFYIVSPETFPNPLEFVIDPKMKGFGSHCLLVYNKDEFINKVKRCLSDKKLKYNCDYVSYYDKNLISRSLTPFQKPNDFVFQKEYRFYVQSESLEPLIFKIGNLKEIAGVYDTELIIDGLRLKNG